MMEDTLQRELYLYQEMDNEGVIEIIEQINLINEFDEECENVYTDSVNDFIQNNVNLSEGVELKITPYSKKPIILHINCFGGVFEDGIALYNTIKGSGTPINGVVDGACYSMAVPILLACHVRYGYKLSKIMIHDVHTSIVGKGRDIERQLDAVISSRSDYMTIITENTLIKSDKIEEIVDKGIDWYLDAEESYNYGIFDILLDVPDCGCGDDE